MSEHTKETKTDKKFTVRDLVWVLVGVIVGILIGWAVFTTTLASSVDSIGTNTTAEITATIEDAQQ